MITFADPETVTIAGLRPGDFVVEIPAQHGVRGTRVNSGLREMTRSGLDGRGPVYMRSPGYRRRRYAVDTRRLTFLSGGPGVCYPADFRVVVRRRTGTEEEGDPR